MVWHHSCCATAFSFRDCTSFGPLHLRSTKSSPALEVLSAILGDGKSSRLYRSLVYERQIARDVSVYHYGQEIAGEFFVQVTANAGQSLEEIEALVRDELESIRQSGPTEHEIQRAKNRIESQHVRQL